MRLVPELVEHLNSQNAFPKYRGLDSWVRKHYGSFSSAIYCRFAANGSGAAHYPRAVMDFILRGPSEQIVRKHILGAVVDFMRSKGWTGSSEPTLEQVLSYVAEPSEVEDDLDVFLDRDGGVAKIADWLDVADRCVAGCYDMPEKPLADAVKEIVRWMVIEAGRLSTGNKALPEPKAIEIAQRLMGISESEYARFALGWREANPWTVVYCRNGERLVGQGIVLPVTEHHYREVVAGRRASYECGREDIKPMSSYLILESAFQAPRELKPPRSTVRLMLMLLTQIGVLSRCDRFGRDQPLHLLSFAPHPLAERRLARAGFTDIRMRMKRSGVPLMEKVFHDLSSDKVGRAHLALMKLLAPTVARPPEP